MIDLKDMAHMIFRVLGNPEVFDSGNRDQKKLD